MASWHVMIGSCGRPHKSHQPSAHEQWLEEIWIWCQISKAGQTHQDWVNYLPPSDRQSVGNAKKKYNIPPIAWWLIIIGSRGRPHKNWQPSATWAVAGREINPISYQQGSPYWSDTPRLDELSACIWHVTGWQCQKEIRNITNGIMICNDRQPWLIIQETSTFRCTTSGWGTDESGVKSVRQSVLVRNTRIGLIIHLRLRSNRLAMLGRCMKWPRWHHNL